MDPNLSRAIECLQKMRQQLEQLFQFSRISETATDMQIEAAIQPVDVFGQSSQSISPDDDKQPSEDLPLPVFLISSMLSRISEDVSRNITKGYPLSL